MTDANMLSAGSLEQILDNLKPANPILQIIGYKPMTPDQMAFGQHTEDLRYRLMIGDGVRTHQYCVITNQDTVEDIKSGRLEKWSIVKVTSYQTVDYGEGPPENKRRLIYILNLEIIKRGSEVGQKLVAQPGGQQTPQADSRNNINNFQQPLENSYHQQQQNRPQNPSMNSYGLGNNNFSSPQHTQPQPYPMGSHGIQPDSIRSPRQIRGSHDNQTIGIGELTPYIGKWAIKGRITSKSAIREYNNAKGGGKLFSFTIADKTGEIKVTGFNADCERYYAYVEPNKVYILSRASVKAADKRYSTADFEMTLNSDTLLEELIDSKETSEIPLAKFNFVSIGSLTNLQSTQPVDLIGIIHELSDVSSIMSKTKNKEIKKRAITIVDMSRHSISVTIWDSNAESFRGLVGDVFVTKAARLGTYGGRSASAGDCMFINPDIPEVRKMKSWYNNLLDTNFTALTASTGGGSGGSDEYKSLVEMMNLEQAKIIESSGQSSAAYAKCRAILMAVGKNPVYKCCPTDNCGKKLVDTQNGELKCEKCQQTYTNYKYRYKTDIEIGDKSNSCWVTLWDEKAETIFGMKPEEMERKMRDENKDAYERAITAPTFSSFLFTLRIRVDNYNQEERVKLHVINLTPLESVSYSKKVIEEIKSMGSS